MSKKYGFLMFFSIAVEAALLVLSAIPFLNLFNPVGTVIDDSFISNLGKKIMFESLGDTAFVLAIIGLFVVGIYLMSYFSSWGNSPVKSAIAFVVFAVIAAAVLGIQTVSLKSAPEPVVSKMEVVSSKMDSEFDINAFMNLFLGSKTEQRRSLTNGVFMDVPKLCFEHMDAEVSRDEYGKARPGDEYYVVMVAGESYAYPASEYSQG